MTGFQLTRPRVAPAPARVEPVQAPAAESPIRAGRHASEAKARLTLRRLFYSARHAAR